MGATHSTKMQSTLQFVTSTTFSSIVSVQSSCKTTSNSTQNTTINVSSDTGVLNHCLDTAGLIGYDCSKLMASAKISGVNQSADLQITSNCKFDDSTAAQLQSSVAAQLQSKMADQTDAVGQALMNVTQAIGGKNQSDTQLKQTITNTVNESFSSSTVNSMLSAYSTSQNAAINVNTASADIANITQFTQLKAVSDMLAQNKTLQTAASSVDAQMASDESSKTKGLTDVVDSAAGVVNNAVDKGTGVVNNAIFGISTVWIAIGGASIAAVVVIIFLMTRKGKAAVTVAPSGQVTTQYQPSAMSQLFQAAPGMLQSLPMRRF